MVMEKKRGQIGFTQILIGLLILFVAFVGVVALINRDKGGEAITYSIEKVSGQFMDVLGPFLTFILNLGSDVNTNFLMVLTFILISIVIVGTLDSVNIFGDDKQGGLINLAMGIIVSIIGVRFMPANMWVSLTAPSSAFVATILVGVPFFALFFITMKIKFNLARKLLWLFYIIFMSYLIFFPSNLNLSPGTTTGMLTGENRFAWIYIIFLILAGIMLFFDSTVRRWFYMEKHKKDIEDTIGQMNAQQRYSLRRQIERWQEIIGDPTASKQDVAMAKTQIQNAENIYGDISAI